MNEKTDRGQEAEDLVQEICHRMFLSDFIVRNPKFLKGNAKKEAADLLAPFGGTLLAFQVKSKTETKSALEKDERDFQRIDSKVKDGARQLNTIKTALMSGQLTTITNDAGGRDAVQGRCTDHSAGNRDLGALRKRSIRRG